MVMRIENEHAARPRLAENEGREARRRSRHDDAPPRHELFEWNVGPVSGSQRGPMVI